MLFGICGFSPEFLQSLVAAAAIAVELVAHRVFLVVVLVVVLGRIKSTGLGYRGYNRRIEGFQFDQRGLRLFCQFFLFGIVIVDFAAVLVPPVAKLAVGVCRVNVVSEYVQ